MEHQFKKGDKVLVRDADSQEWRFGFYYSSEEESAFKYVVLTGKSKFKQCIPYDENKDLVGTKINPNEKKEPERKFTPGQQLYDAETDEIVTVVGYNPDGTVKTASVCVGYRDCSPDVLCED